MYHNPDIEKWILLIIRSLINDIFETVNEELKSFCQDIRNLLDKTDYTKCLFECERFIKEQDTQNPIINILYLYFSILLDILNEDRDDSNDIETIYQDTIEKLSENVSYLQSVKLMYDLVYHQSKEIVPSNENENLDCYYYSLLGIIQLNKGNGKFSDIFIEKSLSLNPYCQFSLLIKAWIECESKSYSQALERLNYILEHDPNHLFALSLAYYASIKLEKYNYAETYSFNAVALDQSNEQSWIYFLVSLAYQKKWNRLLLFSKKCIMTLSHRSSNITLLTSVALFKIGKLESAQQLINSLDESELNDKINSFKKVLSKAILNFDNDDDDDDDESNEGDLNECEKEFIPNIELPPIHVKFQNNIYDYDQVIPQTKEMNENELLNRELPQIRFSSSQKEEGEEGYSRTYQDLDYKSLFIKDRFGSESKILSMYSFSNFKRYSSRIVRRSARSIRREDLQDFIINQDKLFSKDESYDNDDINIERKWHEELYQFINCPIYTEQELDLKCSIMKLFANEFKRVALEDSIVLIKEKYLPIENKTFKPSKKYPNLYFKNGITYCFIDDNNSKRHSIKTLNSIFNNFSVLFGHLLTPPSIIVNYLGETVLCTATISENECFDLNSPSISNILIGSLLTSRLNIINYKIESLIQSLDTNPKEKTLYIKNPDGILTIESDSIDYAIAFKGKKNYLRPELVSVWNRRLCVNIETTKINQSDDNMIIGSKEDIDSCTNWLIKQWIPSWSKHLTFEMSISSFFDKYLHDSGINIRHLGIVSNNCKNDYVRKDIIEKCIARTIKTLYSDQLRLRRSKNENNIISDEEIRTFTVALLNIIFRNKNNMWETFIIPLLRTKFPTINIDNNFKFENIEDNIVSLFSLFGKITNILGLTWSDQMIEDILKNESFFLEEKPFKVDQLHSVSPKIKLSESLYGEEGWRNRININQLSILDYNADQIKSIINQIEHLYGKESDEVFHAKWTIVNDLYKKGYHDIITDIKIDKTLAYKYNHIIMLLLNVYKFPYLLSVESKNELEYLLSYARTYFGGKGHLYALAILNILILSQNMKVRVRESKLLDKIPDDDILLLKKAWNITETYQNDNNCLLSFTNIFDKYIQTIAPFYHMPSITVQMIREFGEDSIILASYYLSLCFSHCKRTQFDTISNYIMWPKTALRIVQSNRKSTILESQCWWMLGLLESNKDIKISHYKRCLKLLTYIASPKYSYDDFPFLGILYNDWKNSISPLLLIDFNTRWIEFLEKLDTNSYASKVLLNDLKSSTSAIELLYNNLADESDYRNALESLVNKYDNLMDIREDPMILNIFGYVIENEWIDNSHQILPGLYTRNVLVPNFNIQNVGWPVQYIRCHVTILDGRFHGKGVFTFNQSLRLLTSTDVLMVEFNSGIITGSKNKIFFMDGTSYEGELVNGIPHGNGTMITPNWLYKGEFKNNLKHGKGTLSLHESNEEIKTYWNNDKMTENYDSLINKAVNYLIGCEDSNELRTFLLNKRKKSERVKSESETQEDDKNTDVEFTLDIKEILFKSLGIFLLRDSNKPPEVCDITLTKRCFINIDGLTTVSMNLKETIVAALLGEEKDDIIDFLKMNENKLQDFLKALPSKSFNSDSLGCLLFSNFSGQNVVLVVDKRVEKKWLKYSISAMGGEKVLYNYIFIKQIRKLLKGRETLSKESFQSLCNELKHFSTSWNDISFWRELCSGILSLPNNDLSLYKQLVIASILMFSDDSEGSFKLALDQFYKLAVSDVPKEKLSKSLLVSETLDYILNTIKFTTYGSIIGKVLELLWNLPYECIKDTWWYRKDNIQLLNKLSSYNSLTLYQRCISINTIINLSLFGPDADEIDLERLIENNLWRKCKNIYDEAKNDINVKYVVFDSIDKILYSRNCEFMKKIISMDGRQINTWKQLSKSTYEELQKIKRRNSQSYESYTEELMKLGLKSNNM